MEGRRGRDQGKTEKSTSTLVIVDFFSSLPFIVRVLEVFDYDYHKLLAF